MPALLKNSAATKCVVVPAPPDAYVSLPGLSFITASPLPYDAAATRASQSEKLRHRVIFALRLLRTLLREVW